jgi:hypothetical protein
MCAASTAKVSAAAATEMSAATAGTAPLCSNRRRSNRQCERQGCCPDQSKLRHLRPPLKGYGARTSALVDRSEFSVHFNIVMTLYCEGL